MRSYRVQIIDGKYPKEFACQLHTQLTIWHFHFWYHIKTQRGPLVHICKMAYRWADMMKCEVVDNTLPDLDPYPMSRLFSFPDKAMASNPQPFYTVPDIKLKSINLNKKK